ncbi:hypothetical protein C8R41DRAFT_914994 [Lentinula lateritia]|uniref:Uncharacterized protein n=1 Tax=Lentinula lateritia TaxID=40482 RepID=A0ABQ8VVT8_9AGAR|nr:hypothetical protein C8R41DRAFT_914994 [Lentinula lateritia]
MVQIYTVLGALLAAEAASILALPVSVSEVGIVTDVPSLLQPSFVKSQERQLEQNRGVDGQPDNPKKRRTLANEAPINSVDEGKLLGTISPAVIEPLEKRLIELSKEPTKDASYKQLLKSLISNLQSSQLLKDRLTSFSQSRNPPTLVQHALAILITQLRLAFQKQKPNSSDHILHEISKLSDFYQMKILSKWAGSSNDVNKQDVSKQDEELNAHIDEMVEAKDATSKYWAQVNFNKWFQAWLDLSQGERGISGGNAKGGTSEKAKRSSALKDIPVDQHRRRQLYGDLD